MSEKILKGIGNYIGHHVNNCQNNFNGVWKEYLRIRVSINLNNPLRRRMKMKMNGEEWFWVNFRYENVPMFCFICGIVGHSEKYCSKLFEHEAEEIPKPYGAWLRAPFRGQVKPIGAKWLRTEMFTGNDSQSPEKSNGCNEGSDKNPDPHFAPTNQQSSYKGENQGNKESQLKKSDAGKEIIHNQKTAATITDQGNIRTDFAFIESKKRRIEEGLGSSHGLNKDIIMDLSDEQEIEQQHNPTETSDPKNGLRAGVHVDARLAL